MIKAICRWKTDASAVLYARLLQYDEYAAVVHLAMGAKITPALIATTRRDCVLGNVHCVQRAGGALGKAAARRTAASPSGPPTRTAADSRDDASVSSGLDDDSDGEADGVVVAGLQVDADSIGPGDAVAVRFNSR